MITQIESKVKEILEANGLDFRIIKLPLVAETREVINEVNVTKKIHSPYFGLLNSKTGEIINAVKQGYTVSQNDEIVELVLRGIEPFSETLKVTKAGSINGGRKIYLQLQIEGDSKVGDDVIKRNITIIDSNDGSTGLSVGIGDLTMSCQNQFYKFYNSGISKMRHTHSIEAKILEIPTLIQNALSHSLEMIEQYKVFTGVKVSDNDIHRMVKHVSGISRLDNPKELNIASTRKINAMNELYDSIRRETLDKGRNGWGLHSGVTYWTTHIKSAPKRENGRIESLIVGTNYKVNQKSLQFIGELV
jgi:hypothetical protein